MFYLIHFSVVYWEFPHHRPTNFDPYLVFRVNLALRENACLLYYEQLLRIVPLCCIPSVLGKFSRSMSNSNLGQCRILKEFYQSHQICHAYCYILDWKFYSVPQREPNSPCCNKHERFSTQWKIQIYLSFFIITTNAVQRKQTNLKFHFNELKKFRMFHAIEFRIIINAFSLTDCFDNLLNSITKHNERELK